MKEIFTDLYKKVLGFFQTQEKSESCESKNVAVNRMKLVLMQDRTNLTPFLLEKMRGEMIEVLAKYVEMDKDALELNFEQEGEQMALMLSIPVIRAKDEEEIQAILDEEKNQADQENELDEEIIQDEINSEESEENSDVQEKDEEEICECKCTEDEECSCAENCQCQSETQISGDEEENNSENELIEKEINDKKEEIIKSDKLSKKQKNK